MIHDLKEQIEATCRLCNPQEKQRILYEAQNFYVMLSLGPIVEGYCLLVSKQHVPCCAEIPEELQKEFKRLYEGIHKILVETYGSCVSYEHGRAGSCLIPAEGSSKHCYHAHMHFVPIPTTMNTIVSEDFKSVLINDLSLLGIKYRERFNSSYLFVHDVHGMNIYFTDKPIRSQYLRYKAAISIDKENLWDWVTHQGWDQINSGFEILSPKFKHLNP